MGSDSSSIVIVAVFFAGPVLIGTQRPTDTLAREFGEPQRFVWPRNESDSASRRSKNVCCRDKCSGVPNTWNTFADRPLAQ
jgi:hypothetical protein